MSHDVISELRRYADFLETPAGPLTVDEIMHHTGTIQEVHDQRVVDLSGFGRRWRPLIVAALLIVFVGVTLLLGVLRSDVPVVDNVPTTSVPSSTPSSAPLPGAISGEGSLETPIGTVDWWYLNGSSTTVPEMGDVFRTASGYGIISSTPAGETGYWTSPDGRTWQPGSLSGLGDPEYVATFGLIDSEYWVGTNDGLFKTADGETWEQVPSLPQVDGDPGGVWPVNGGLWTVDWNPPTLWRLDGSEWVTVDVGDVAEQGGRNPNYSPGPMAWGDSLVVPWFFYGEGVLLSLVGPGGETTVVRPPWSTANVATEMAPEPSISIDGDRIIAYVRGTIPGTECPETFAGPTGQCPTLEAWSSIDGVTWDGPVRMETMEREGYPATGGFASFYDGQWTANVVRANAETQETERMISDDGITWVSSGIPPQSSFLRGAELGSGVVNYGDNPWEEMFFSADKRSWSGVDTSEAAIFAGDEGGERYTWVSSVDDTAFFTRGSGSGAPAELWGMRLRD